MRLPFSVVAFLYSLSYLCNCASATKVVSYTITRALPEDGQSTIARFSRRANYGEILTNNISLASYYASVQVGTPAQTLQLILGTGSGDVWVLDKGGPQCSNGNCLTPFNPNSSQTISTVAAGAFNTAYVDGTYAKGDYIKDVFAIGQAGEARMILQMGLATNISTSLEAAGGIMGIGYDNQESTSAKYLNFMDQMVHNQLTNTKLYSLWLNDVRSSTGSILFGGIDTEKYYGTLYSMPIKTDSLGNYTSFKVGLTSLSITPAAGGSAIGITNSSFSVPVILESSTTMIYLPGYVVDTIYNTFDVSVVSGTAYIDCKYSNSSYMSFGFESGSIVNVAYSEIINKIGVPKQPPSGLPFSDVCVMGILNGDSSEMLLGDFFLRSAYVVYDLTNNRIGIAQSNLNSTTSNIVEVPAGAASIPQSTGVTPPNPSATTPTSSPTVTSTTPTSSHTTTSTNSPTSSLPPKKDNHTVAIGVGIAVPVVVILAAILGFYFWRRRHRASQTETGTARISELYTPANTAEIAALEKKNSHSGNESHYNASSNGGMQPRSHLSELPSGHNSASASPRGMNEGFQRKPVAQSPIELHADGLQGEG